MLFFPPFYLLFLLNFVCPVFVFSVKSSIFVGVNFVVCPMDFIVYYLAKSACMPHHKSLVADLGFMLWTSGIIRNYDIFGLSHNKVSFSKRLACVVFLPRQNFPNHCRHDRVELLLYHPFAWTINNFTSLTSQHFIGGDNKLNRCLQSILDWPSWVWSTCVASL